VDYVPLGARGETLRRPYAYRDPRTRGRLDEAVRRAGGADALYERTGIQFLEINTLPQIVADLLDEPALVTHTAKRLMIAEWLLYRLSGRMVAERTNASTTQLMDVRTGRWDHELMRLVGDDPARWPEIVPPGTMLGPAQDALGVLVIASCAHDTGAAVAAVPATRLRPWAFISSGTWSLVGAELEAPILAAAAREAGFTNEAGLDGTIRFLKNRTGMWALEECIRAWESEDGARPSYEALMRAAEAAPPSERTIDLNAPALGTRGDMPAMLRAACAACGVEPPADRGAFVRLILDSLAASYAAALDELDALTGRRSEDVHVVGGGARNALLNQLTADACGRHVFAGPEEATVLGNLLVQARTLGNLPGTTVREAARKSSRITEYTPRTTPALR
jgi:rhamnulokinase